MPLSPIRYPGGKSRAVKILEPYIPDDVEEVISPFFGGGSFENHLSLKGIRVRGYDLCKPLVDFWQSFLEDKETLLKLTQEKSDLMLDPKYEGDIPKEVRQEQIDLYNVWKDLAYNSPELVERGSCYWAMNRASFSGMTLITGPCRSKSMWSHLSKDKLERLSKIPFEVESVKYQGFADTLPRHKNSFLYLDPPYVMETKEKEVIYGDNKGDLHSGFDHKGLRDLLDSHKERWVLSYLDVPEIRELYSNYKIENVTWTYSMKRGDSRPKGAELVIYNFDRQKRVGEN